MSGKALWSGLKSYLGALLATILFPILWMRMVRLARRHRDVDPRGVMKVGVAIVVSLAILGGGVMQLTKFQDGAVTGMYHSMDTRVKSAVGEAEYQDNVQTIGASDVAIPIIQRNLANETAANHTDKAKDLQTALDAAQAARAKAVARVSALEPNHQLYTGRLQPAILAKDDATIRSAIEQAALTDPAHVHANVEAAFAIKDRSVHDMQRSMLLFVWPSLAGAFFAPMAFAAGSVLSRAFVPSDTVGYKPYPSGAAGFFLLFGAFGLPSVPFAAWVFLDQERRSTEGQIAL